MNKGIFLPLNDHSIWYLGLGTISLILLIYTYLKTKNPRCLLLFFNMVGLSFTIEFFIYVLFESYDYSPKILSNDEYYDNNMGALASNSLTLPSSATLIAAFHLRWIWIIIITCFVVGTEWLFLKLGIYHHNWWRLEFTAIGLIFYYNIAKFWFKQILLPLTGFRHSVTLFFILWSFCTMQFLSIAFFHSRYYSIGWFENQSHNTTFVSALIGMLSSVFFVCVLKRKWKYLWLKFTLPAFFIGGINKLLQMIGVLHSLVWWDISACIGMNMIILIIGNRISKRLWKGPDDLPS